MAEPARVTVPEILDQHGAQTRIAQEIGCARAVVHRWVRGISVPSGPRLVALTDYIRRYVPEITEKEVLHEVMRRRGETSVGKDSRQPQTVGAQEDVAS